MKLLDLENVNCSLVRPCSLQGITNPSPSLGKYAFAGGTGATALCIPPLGTAAVVGLTAHRAMQDEIVREAQTMRQQLHSNVLPLYTSFVHEQNLWMVMPYVSSGSVLNIMKYAHPEVSLLLLSVSIW